MVQNYVLHWYFSDSNISYLTEYLMSKIYEYDKSKVGSCRANRFDDFE